jgi:hypothetical protein
MIRSNLFDVGGPLKAEAGLSDVLEGRKRGVVNRIRAISDLDEMTDPFLEGLVRKSLVEPLAIHFNRMTRKQRTETLNASYLPSESMGGRRYLRVGDFPLEGGNQKQVVRLILPFSGEGDLLTYCPNSCTMNFPQGEVNGKTIQFDVILWGSSDDAQRVRDEIRSNCDLIVEYAGKINQQVKAFNESLSAQVKAAFAAKLDELTKQRAILDDLGIPEEPEPRAIESSPIPARPKTARSRVVHVTQYIDSMFVQQLNQTNYNVGDVNNAIQSSE